MGAGPRRSAEVDEDDCCEHGVPLWELCERCEGDGLGIFDADELGLDPEDDDKRAFPGGSDA